MSEKPIYKNDSTGFITYIKPLCNKLYYKVKNDTVAVINVSENWEMSVDIVNPFAFTLVKYGADKEWAENLIVQLVPRDMERILRVYNIERYDTAVMLYRSRGINYVRDDWFAWSEDDKIEDYHPRFNKALDNCDIIEDDK